MDGIYDVERIGPLLARLREERGMSQLAVAERLCAVSGSPTVSRHEVSRWERLERIPSAFWLQWLAEVFDVPPQLLHFSVKATKPLRVRTRKDTRVAVPKETAALDLREAPLYPPVSAWLTFHHGPKEIVIALGGLEVDQIRTVLAPVTPPDESATDAVHLDPAKESEQ